MDSPPNTRRLSLVALSVSVALLLLSGGVAASPADSSTSLSDNPVFQIDVSVSEDEDEDEGVDEDDNEAADRNESTASVSDSDSESGTERETDGNSSLTAEEQEQLDDLPIDVNEDDIDSDDLNTENDSGAHPGDDGTEQIGGGLGPSLSPEDNAEALTEWFIGLLYSATETLIDDVFNNMLGTPTPENDGWQGILGQPVGETYSDLYEEVYMQMILPPVFQFMVLGFIGFVLFIVPFSPITGQRVWSVVLAMFGAAALVLFAWNFASLLHHVSDAVTMWFLPESSDFLSGSGISEEAELELASGPLAVLLGVYFASWNIGIGLLLIHGMRQAVLFLMPTILPIILVGMYFGPKTSKAAFSVLFWQYIGLLVMNWPTALLLSIAYHVNFDFGMGEIGTLPDLAATIGLFAFAIGIPLFVQTSFLGGSLVAIVMKGSVLSAGANTARKYVPTAAVGGAAKSAAKRGGGYINPVSRFKRTNSESSSQDRQRRTIATQRRPFGAPASGRSKRLSTDGGHTTGTRTQRTTPPKQDTMGSATGHSQSTHSAGSVDARRRERYRRLRGDDSV